MVQKTKTASKAVEDTQDEVPAEVNEQSAKVSEEACCLLSEIDSILEDVAKEEPVAEEWDAATAEQPDWDRDYEAKYRELYAAGKINEAYDVEDEYAERLAAWFDYRGISNDRCVC